MSVSLSSPSQLPMPPAVSLNAQASFEQAEKAGKDYETMVFSHFLKQMFDHVDDSAVWGDGQTGDFIKSWFVESVAKQTKNTGLGLAPKITQSILAKMNVRDEKRAQHDLIA